MKIFLIGMPGSGKSTVGKQLATNLSIPFIDLDSDIENREGKLVKDIFSEAGEGYFREVESTSLKYLASSPDSFVLATGGGAPCFHNGINIINESGVSIFLDIPVEELVARVEKETNRPLLLSSDKGELKTKLETIRNSRLKFYQQAKITVPDSNLETILRKLTP